MSFYGKSSQELTGGGGGGGSGTVTSVAFTASPSSVFDVSGSPVTTSGTIALSMDNQSANTVLAGPTSGGAAAPAFRALVSADLPAASVTFPLNASGGTASAPDYSWTSTSSNTGLYLAATDTIGIALDGLNQMTLGTNLYQFGRVGGDSGGYVAQPIVKLNVGNLSSGGYTSYLMWSDGTASRNVQAGVNIDNGGTNGVFGIAQNGNIMMSFNSAGNGSGLLCNMNNGANYNAVGGKGLRVGGVYNWTYAAAGTGANTTETTLASKSLPAVFFFNIGDALQINTWGTFAANANNKTIKLTFGGTTICDSTALAINGGSWRMDAIVADDAGNNSQTCSVNMTITDGSGATTHKTVTTATTETVSGALIVAMKATNGTSSANDIVLNGWVVRGMPGRNN